MARNAYTYEKRRREALKRAKKEKKRQRREALSSGQDPDGTPVDENAAGDTAPEASAETGETESTQDAAAAQDAAAPESNEEQDPSSESRTPDSP